MSKLQEVWPDELIEGKYYYIIETGRPGKAQKQVLDHLLQHRRGLQQVHSVDKCDFILVFCIISSRAGTDISAALNKLNDSSAFKPAIIVVLYHTFDSDRTVLDSSGFINRENTLTVDCLFHEDTGLLKCNTNDKALARIVQGFKQESWTLIGKLRQLWEYKKQHKCSAIIITVISVMSVYLFRFFRQRWHSIYVWWNTKK